jgi:hypothetical protein
LEPTMGIDVGVKREFSIGFPQAAS